MGRINMQIYYIQALQGFTSFIYENSINNRPRLQYSSNMRKRTKICKISQERLHQEETGPQDLRQVRRGLQGLAQVWMASGK